MYHPQSIVGEVFEKKLMQIFDLAKVDISGSGHVPDLASKDFSFYVEVKASAYNNGGVIKGPQLKRFDKNMAAKRFYAFAYHSITDPMHKVYLTRARLKNALDLKSLFLFPFSIVKAHYNNSKKVSSKYFEFVQMKESTAQKVFDKNELVWEFLRLNKEDYKMNKPHEKIHIITREGNLEKEILNYFHPELL